MGPERRSRLISPAEKEIIAYHEAGHAVAIHFVPDYDPLFKVTIVPRGMAGGYAMPLPEEESNMFTREKLRSRLVVALGGRVAEEIKFVDITTGASNDLEQVSSVARAMVTQLGMSDKLGPIRYGEREDLVFLGREISERRNYSDKVAQEIDEEIHRLVNEAHQRCHQLLSTHWDKVDVVAAALLTVETIDAQQFQALMRGENPFPSQENPGQRQSAPGTRDEAAREHDKRSDSGVDLGGTLPAPA